jgi:uncharacterized RDD family membrane protein YckC
VFAWNFERTTSTPADVPLVVFLVLVASAAMLLYYAIPLVRFRPSPGACVLGYQVLPEPGEHLTLSRSLYRASLGFIAVCAAYVAPFVGRDQKKGKFWLDKMFRTRAVLLS